MNALPEGWLPERSSISFTTPGHGYQSYYFPEKNGQNNERRRFLEKHDGHVSLSREKHSKILDIVEDYEDRRKDYVDDRRKTYDNAMALLNSVTTVNRAIEVWPEAEFFIRKAVGAHAKSNAPVPVIMTENLNKQLGLPPSKKETA